MANLINYFWISEYDELQEKRVSDWGHAENCGICGRKIVHVYTVQHDDTTTYSVVGRECAHKVLGLTKSGPTVKGCLKNAEIIAAKRAREIKGWNETAAKYLKPSRRDASIDCRRRNSPASDPGRGGRISVAIYHNEALGGYYAIPDTCAEEITTPTVERTISQGMALREGGWVRVA